MNRLTRHIGVVVAGGLALLIGACGQDTAAESSSNTGETRTVATAFGDVAVPAEPKRVITLSEPALDTALALGITPVGTTAARGGDKAPEYLGAQAASIPVVATISEPNLEAILEADPDLILAGSSLSQEQYNALSAMAPTVVPKAGLSGWRDQVRTYAEALGKAEEIDARLAAIDERAKSLGAQAGEGTFAVVRWMKNGPMVMNASLMPGQILQAAGLKPVQLATELGDKGHSDPLSLENLSQIDADYVFIATFNADGKAAFEEARSQPAFTRLDAVKRDSVAVVAGGVWSSSSGPIAAEQVLNDIEALLNK
jgi:iron complex transport system substrate-binding protein